MSQTMAGAEKDNGFEIRLRTGWKDEETQLLLNEVKKAEERKLPLKAVFMKVADATGRKPNSIRNYYYLKAKEDGSGLDKRTVSFTPFTKAEIRKLIYDVLKSQGEGESVRSATLRLGGNDRHKMLRYQNKYRSVIKNNRALVQSVIEELENNGEKYFNPYTEKTLRGRKPMKYTIKQPDIVEMVGATIKSLNETGQDVEGFLRGLMNIAKLASMNKGVQLNEEHGDLREEIALLNAKLSERERALNEQKGELSALRLENDLLLKRQKELIADCEKEKQKLTRITYMYNQLIKVNRDFLELNGLNKVSVLSEYITELTRRMNEYEKQAAE
jgi:hypothetical protein